MAKWHHLEAENKCVYKPRQMFKEAWGMENRWWGGRGGEAGVCPAPPTSCRFKCLQAVYGLNAHSSTPLSSETRETLFKGHPHAWKACSHLLQESAFSVSKRAREGPLPWEGGSDFLHFLWAVKDKRPGWGSVDSRAETEEGQPLQALPWLQPPVPGRAGWEAG